MTGIVQAVNLWYDRNCASGATDPENRHSTHAAMQALIMRVSSGNALLDHTTLPTQETGSHGEQHENGWHSSY
jgi:hypothetical protein